MAKQLELSVKTSRVMSIVGCNYEPIVWENAENRRFETTAFAVVLVH